jgi:hypothetical protein
MGIPRPYSLVPSVSLLAPSAQRPADREQAPVLAYRQMRGAEHQQAFRVPSVTRRAHSERLQCLTLR